MIAECTSAEGGKSGAGSNGPKTNVIAWAHGGGSARVAAAASASVLKLPVPVHWMNGVQLTQEASTTSNVPLPRSKNTQEKWSSPPAQPISHGPSSRMLGNMPDAPPCPLPPVAPLPPLPPSAPPDPVPPDPVPAGPTPPDPVPAGPIPPNPPVPPLEVVVLGLMPPVPPVTVSTDAPQARPRHARTRARFMRTT